MGDITLHICKLISVHGWIGAFATLAAYAIPISSRTMSFPADLLGGNLRQPPLPKTRQIIALPPPKSNRKAKLLPTARLSQMRAFFAHTSLQVVFTSCPGCFQIIMQEKNGYTHGNPLRTSHIAICEVNGNKQKPIPHNRSTKPKAKQYLAPHPKPIQSFISPTCPTSRTRHISRRQSSKHQSAARQLPC